MGMAGEGEMKFRFDATSGFFEREAERLSRLVAELGDANPADLANWDLVLSDSERKEAEAAMAPLGGRPFIVCGPGTKMPAKDWGQDNWQALLGRIDAKYPGHGLALVGAKGRSVITPSPLLCMAITMKNP